MQYVGVGGNTLKALFCNIYYVYCERTILVLLGPNICTYHTSSAFIVQNLVHFLESTGH